MAPASGGENQPTATGDQVRRGIGANPDAIDPHDIVSPNITGYANYAEDIHRTR